MKETKFKQTEVGMIPSDWEVKTISEIAESVGDGIHSTPAYSGLGTVFFINGNNIKDGKLILHNDTKKVDESVARKYSFPISKRTLLMSINGTIGNIAPYNNEPVILGKSAAYISVRRNYNRIFLMYMLQMDYVKQFFENSLTGSTIKNLGLSTIRETYIKIPPTVEEQQRIATALSDVDTLIANLEKLIAKKKNIKQGAMQQLLTGKKRLPRFAPDERTGSRPTDERRKECHSERSAKREVEESCGYKMTELGLIPIDWEVKPIKELGLFLGGGTPSTKNESFWKGNIPWISSADLNDDDIEHISMTRFITQEAVNFSATQICPQGTILIIARVGVGKLALSQQKVCTSQDFCNLIPSKENDSKFLAYALLPVMKRMSNESQGTSIKGVAVDEIKKVQIIVPSSKAEQTAIANVLSDMDTEISALETKLAKYRTLKTGMMQQLLTGKIRLK